MKHFTLYLLDYIRILSYAVVIYTSIFLFKRLTIYVKLLLFSDIIMALALLFGRLHTLFIGYRVDWIQTIILTIAAPLWAILHIIVFTKELTKVVK